MSKNSLHLFKFENKEDADNFLEYMEEVPTTLRSFPTRTITTQPIYDVRDTSTILGEDPITNSYHVRENVGMLRVTSQMSLGSIQVDNVNSSFITSNMVGIGTTTPTTKLDVFNGTTDGSILRLRGGNATTPDHGPRIDFSIGNTTTTDNYVGAAIKSLNFFTGDQHAAHLAFYTRSWNGSAYSGLDERMRITSGGNVGIGTTTPTETLQINGTLQVGDTQPIGDTAKFKIRSTDGKFIHLVNSGKCSYYMNVNDDLLHNYTMGKITMDCDFQPKNMPVYKIDADNQLIPSTDMYNNIVTKPAYRTRYLKPDGSIISKDEYHSILQSGGVVYVAAFVGCTYHCG